MAISISADYLNEVLPGSKQTPEIKRSAVDETFQKIFSSIQETSRQINNKVDEKRARDATLTRDEIDRASRRDETDRASRKYDENTNDNNIEKPVRDTDRDQANKADDKRSESDESAQVGDKVAVQEKPEKDKTDDKELTQEEIKEKILKFLNELMAGSGQAKDTGKNLTDLEKAASIIAKKLLALSESDPSAFEKLMEDLSKISLKDKGKNAGQAISQMIKLMQTTDAQSQASQTQDDKNVTVLLKKALEQVEKTDSAPGDKKAVPSDLPEKGEKRADGQPFDKAVDAGKDSRATAKAANNKDTASQQSVAKQVVTNEAVKSAEGQVKADVKPNSVKITNNILAQANPPPGNSSKTASADRPQVAAKFMSREVFERMLVDQIVRKARVNIRANGVSNIVVQIDPPNLGKVNIRISVRDNVVKAYMIAENHEVRSIIENNLDNLKNSMNNQGLKVDQVTVTTAEAYTQDRNEASGNDFGSESNRDNQRRAMGAGEAMDTEGEMTTAQVRALAHDGVLNIVA